MSVKHSVEMIKMAQSGERKHTCETCNKGFKTKQHLRDHGSVHTKQKSFNKKKVVHKKSVTYVCQSCGKNVGKRGN